MGSQYQVGELQDYFHCIFMKKFKLDYSEAINEHKNMRKVTTKKFPDVLCSPKGSI
jgi:hypothetical protein